MARTVDLYHHTGNVRCVLHMSHDMTHLVTVPCGSRGGGRDDTIPEQPRTKIHICVWSKVDGVLIGDIPGYSYSILVHFVHLETAGGIAGLLHRLFRENQPYIGKSWRSSGS